MQHNIYSAAGRRIIEIWLYTDKTWGEKQADKCIRGIYQAIDNAARKKYLWRKLEHEDLNSPEAHKPPGVFAFYSPMASSHLWRAPASCFQSRMFEKNLLQ